MTTALILYSTYNPDVQKLAEEKDIHYTGLNRRVGVISDATVDAVRDTMTMIQGLCEEDDSALVFRKVILPPANEDKELAEAIERAFQQF